MSNGKPSFLPNDEQISNKVRVEHQPVNTDQVVYLITRFDSFIHPRWFYTFLLSTVSLRTFIPISLNRTHGVGGGPSVLGDVGWTVDHLGSCGWIWCPGGTGPFLGDRTGSGWGWLVGCLLAWVCKRIRFIVCLHTCRFGGCLLCYVLFFVSLLRFFIGELSNVGTLGELVERRCNGPPEEQSSTSLQIADIFSQFESFKSLQKNHKNLRGALPMPTPPGNKA